MQRTKAANKSVPCLEWYWEKLEIGRGTCHERDDLLAKVLSAVIGNSISINMRSWLKRLSVTPVSVVEKKDMGDLCFVSMRGFD
jgi:hypothetical protein